MKEYIKSLLKPKSKLAECKNQKTSLGEDPFSDIQHFMRDVSEPVIFDIGANIGQSVDRFKQVFPDSSIHSFEPSPTTYEKLKAHCQNYSHVTPWNLGVGARDEQLTFIENENTATSSFLAPTEMMIWGQITKKTNVEVKSLDSFTKDQGINYIDILKSDTQGFDFEVFKGARQLMEENKIGLIYFEFIFSNIYENLPTFDEVFRYLSEQRYLLVSFYDFFFQNELASWTDALFISEDLYKNNTMKRSHLNENFN